MVVKVLLFLFFPPSLTYLPSLTFLPPPHPPLQPAAPTAPGAFAHQCCTNFRLADGAESAAADDPGRVGADRFAALEAALAPAGGVLPDADAAADLLEAVSHRRDDWGPDGEAIVATQWSAVFDLAAPAVTLWPDCDRPRARRFRVTRSGP